MVERALILTLKILATTAGGAAGYLAWAVRGRSAAVFGASVYRGARDSKAVALTFDDGPSESTPLLLQELALHGVPATFFQCGCNVRRLPGIARQVAEAGHEIGNHSDTHPLLCFRSAKFMTDELARAQHSILEATGQTPRLFRAPYGVRWFGLGQAQQETGLTGVMWTVIGRDWKLSAEQISARVVEGSGNGGIICLHDGREGRAYPDISVTIDAVRRIVPELRSRGYEFQTVSRILQARPS
jgi:peptidoglycan/xylan/chitin deacetylase (PgdA/CDA1 family)